MENNKTESKKAISFQEALIKVRKDLSERVTKREVAGKKVESKGNFDPNELVKVCFTKDFHSYSKGETKELGILTGLSYVKMGIAKKA